MHGGIGNGHVSVDKWEVKDPSIPGVEGVDKGIISGTGSGDRVSQ